VTGEQRIRGSAVVAVQQERRRGAITQKHRRVFLKRLAAGFSVAASAAPTGKGRQRYYELRAEDPDFDAAWRHAREAGQDVIEDELLKAATEGWEEVSVSIKAPPLDPAVPKPNTSSDAP
jgi:hypothetical protein